MKDFRMSSQMLDDHNIQYKILESSESAVNAIAEDVIMLHSYPISIR